MEDIMEYKLDASQEVLAAVKTNGDSTEVLVVRGKYKGKNLISVMKYVRWSQYEGPKSVVAIPADNKEAVKTIIDGLTKAIS
jgi:hypothetical protein